MLQTLLTSTLPSIHHVQLSDKDRACSDWTPQVEDLQGNKINLVLSFWETGNNKKDNRATQTVLSSLQLNLNFGISSQF